MNPIDIPRMAYDSQNIANASQGLANDPGLIILLVVVVLFFGMVIYGFLKK